VYRSAEAVVDSASAVGGGKHLRLAVRDASGRAEAIGFGMGGLLPTLRSGTRCALAFVPTRNEWNGTTRIQLKLKGVKPR
jgi:hypothetical protein